MSTAQNNMSLSGEAPAKLSTTQKVATGLGWTGLFILFLALFNVQLPAIFLWSAIVLIAIGVIIFANDLYIGKSAGVKNDGIWFRSMTARGILAWGTGILLTLFYIVLYWFPEYLGYNPDGANGVTSKTFTEDDWREQQQLADFDRLIGALHQWAQSAPPWEPFDRSRALIARIEPRLRELQIHLDQVLVVGVLGGSGTGKSTLINALVGQRVSEAGDVQRGLRRRSALCVAHLDRHGPAEGRPAKDPHHQARCEGGHRQREPALDRILPERQLDTLVRARERKAAGTEGLGLSSAGHRDRRRALGARRHVADR